jgi:anti-repressor protein
MTNLSAHGGGESANPDFSEDVALALLNSEDEFPVDFEIAWQWIGYTTKHKAKLKLTRNFVQDIDFRVFNQTVVKSTPQDFQEISGDREKRGRPTETIYLTLEAFKMLAMMAGTTKGRSVREYFLDCERRAKESANTKPCPIAPRRYSPPKP